MELCRSCDIVYDARICPLCEANKRIAELEEHLENANESIEYLQKEPKQ